MTITTRRPYYRTRQPGVNGPPEYWAPSQDPDGRIRDRLTEQERRQHVTDIAEEIEFLNSLEGGVAVDVGCGPGWLLAELGNQWECYGVEPSPLARGYAKQLGLEVYTTVHPIQSKVDAMVMHHVIEHIDKPIEFMQSHTNKIRRGGWLVLGTPDFESPCAKRFGENYRLLHDTTHVSLFDREGITSLIESLSFRIHKIAFPFPERFATAETFARWKDASKISPPWPGNFITVYASKLA